MAKSGRQDPWEYSLRKYLLLLATLVTTVTYAAGFNPPGGVWQDTKAGHLAGDPIIRDTSYPRYLAFFYCNATAFASSLVVIVLILILAITHDWGSRSPAPLRTLRVVMVLDLLSLTAAYAAGTWRDTLTTVYSLVFLAGAAVYVTLRLAVASWKSEAKNGTELDRLRKVLMLLATFAVSVTNIAGLSAPGGFWDDAGGAAAGRRPGHAVLKGGRHDTRLKAFFVCNTTSFGASLLIIVLLLDKKLQPKDKIRCVELYGVIVVALAGLVAAYSAGSCREVDTTVYVNALIGAVLLCILVQVVTVRCFGDAILNRSLWGKLEQKYDSVLRCVRSPFCCGQQAPDSHQTSDDRGSDEQRQTQQALEKARSLVLLLATLAAAITYQAGLDPPGGLWESDGDGYMAGDPILLTRNPKRYKAFYYCNSVAFVASLVAIVLVRKNTLHKHNTLEAAMILDLFGLIGAYAAGSCRDVSTSIYAAALAGAVLVYVVIHVVFFTLDHHEDDAGSNGGEASVRRRGEELQLLEKRRKRLLLFAILAATITYQAGLTPPSGFLLDDDAASGRRAGDPVLRYNFPRRYTAFFYCNSVSFMLSIALIILLVNKNLYRPAIRSNALSVCTAVGMCGLVGAYAAGSTQHFRTSIYIFVLAGVVLLVVAVLVVVFLVIQQHNHQEDGGAEEGGAEEGIAEDDADDAGRQEKKLHSKRKYLMLLGILVASVTYQAGLEPPGGVWQGDGGGHATGDPVMHDNRRARYHAFFSCNSVSFVASIVVIVLLLPEWLHKAKLWLAVMNMTIVLDLLGLLVAYAAGSSRSWRTTGYVSALVIAVLGYFVIHVVLSFFGKFCRRSAVVSATQGNGEDNVELQTQAV